MGKVFYYDLYEGDALFLQCVTVAEVNKILGLNLHSLTKYVENNWMLCGRYKVCIVEGLDDEVKEDVKKYDTYKGGNFAELWEAAIKPFRRVIWCKDEGRKLMIKKVYR